MNEQYEIYKDGKDYQVKFLELIKNAQTPINIQTYFFQIYSFREPVADSLLSL
jgi:hypothetical protein